MFFGRIEENDFFFLDGDTLKSIHKIDRELLSSDVINIRLIPDDVTTNDVILVKVKVDDVNDNRPIFTLNSNLEVTEIFHIEVSEGTPIGTKVSFFLNFYLKTWKKKIIFYKLLRFSCKLH